jgi:xanthine dehydrogenase YagS FAD-binding subunit
LLHELPSLEYVEAKRIEEALGCLREYGQRAAVLAGGTDLIGLMKDRLEGPGFRNPEVLVGIRKIPKLGRISFDKKGGITIGSAVTLSALEASEGVREKFAILAQASRQVATTPLRNMGTVAGNLCQRPRCVYFRHPDFPCYKKGGKLCYAIKGEHRYYHSILHYGRCVMAHPSDMAPALMALKAEVILAGPEGEKQGPLQDFFVGPNHLGETILKEGEMVTAIRVPPPGGRLCQIFLKQRIRHASDFALASVAAAARFSGSVCEELRIVLGGIAPFPVIASEVGNLFRGKTMDEATVSAAADASVEGARPLSMNGYKIDMVKALVKNALTSLGRQAQEG